MLEKSYNTKSDIWGGGCIIAEMIQCTKKYIDEGLLPNQRFLFPGDSCYPLSPVNNGVDEISDMDQLQVILQCLGRQDHKDLSFITLESATVFIDTAQVDSKKIKFEQEYPYTSQDITNILHSMLEFNPYFRKPASQLLKQDMFKSHHEKEQNFGHDAPEKITLDFDKKGTYDYENFKFTNHTMDDLKKMLICEIDIVRSKEYQSIIYDHD